MPLTPNFTATQSLADNSDITLEDTSTGVDATITTRRIYVELANGNWLTEDGESTTSAFESWAYADDTITLTLLTNSTACKITVQWYAGATLTYTKTEEFCFNLQDYLAGLQILQGDTSYPSQVQDTNYYNNLIQFIVNIFNEENAIEYGADIYSSQGAMNRNQLMIDNESYYF